MNQEIRNKLRNIVTQCRKLLEESIAQELEGKYGVFAQKDQVTADPNAPMTHLAEEEQAARKDILDHFAHIKARGFKSKDALDQLVREIAFTHLNRLCAYKMMEAREVYVGGQKFREAVSRGIDSNGLKFFLADHPEEERLFNTGRQDIAYRHFLDWLGGLLSDEIGVLFSPNDPANRLYPKQKTLDEVLDLLNGGGIKPEERELREQWPTIWSQDETIGWVYQYFTPKELRDQARRESAAPRNSCELAFRNQFFTPRYVVEFLTDNTLGRIWYEMQKGNTKLKDQCRYMVRRPTEVFLTEGQRSPKVPTGRDDLSQEELLKLPVQIPHRPKRDPRELKVLDPASGSGHFLLYCFDLLQTIYEEAYADPELGPTLQRDYPKLDDLKRDVPRLILANNLHGIDIDLRCSQIAALALWLRCQRAFQDMGLKKERPKITRSNFVCAEPMPGEEQMLREFISQLEPRLLGQFVEVVFNKMKLAGEAGSLLKVEEEIRDTVSQARRQWLAGPVLIQQSLFGYRTPQIEQQRFDFSGITDAQFFEQAEQRVVNALREYAEKAHNGQRLSRRLFAEDAERGFAFVDICHKRFDAVLMNPPFGESSIQAFDYFASQYPDWAENLACVSVIRGRSFLETDGLLGVFCDRTVSIKSSYEPFRRNHLIGRISANCDTGWGVLDANVETTAFVLSATEDDSPGLYLNAAARPVSEQPDWIAAGVSTSMAGEASQDCYSYRSADFRKLPNAVIGYYFPAFLVSLFNRWPSLQDSGFQARQGHSVVKEQHARVFWEVPLATAIGKDAEYALMYNGGEYSLYWLPIREVTRYGRAAHHLTANAAVALRNQKHQFLAGIGYGKRGEILDAHVIPSGTVFTDEGQGITGVRLEEAWTTLAFLNSSLAQFSVNQYCGQHKHCGYINLLPLPGMSGQLRDEVGGRCKAIVELKRKWYRLDETCLEFVGFPTIVQTNNLQSLHQAASDVGQQYHDDETRHSEMIRANDEQFVEVASSVDRDRDILRSFEAARTPSYLRADLSTVTAVGELSLFLIAELASWSVGCAYGRWDIRVAMAERMPMVLPDPFDALPSRAPGTLRDEPSGYPLRFNSNGILVDDAEHQDDIVQGVREVLDVISNGKADTVDRDACDILQIKELRDYFRKTGKGGFWDDHISRYTKSRRKAPIYWLLQSSKKNYSIWLYYHRLDKDLIFKALVKYVEPKIRLEDDRLKSLRSEKAKAGDSGKDAKRLAKEVERQEDYLSELRDFEDKLRRAANLHLEPDLNDGVVLNIAALHELVPWKEAKVCWDELLEGKYDWSSIGKQLRQKGLVK